jgi:hypothetical protein
MFFEEIKQIVSTFREAVNQFLSRIFNKGVPIAEDMTTLIFREEKREAPGAVGKRTCQNT